MSALVSNRVRFLVIGAHALAAHGRPRYTGDFDVFIDPAFKNVERACRALDEFGFGADDHLGWLSVPGNGLHFGHPPMRLDVLTAISGVTFEEAWKGRVNARLNDQVVNIIGRTEYIKNKRESGKNAGRAKDLLDISLLEEWTNPPFKRRPGTYRNTIRRRYAQRDQSVAAVVARNSAPLRLRSPR